jgi:hypothetical protein
METYYLKSLSYLINNNKTEPEPAREYSDAEISDMVLNTPFGKSKSLFEKIPMEQFSSHLLRQLEDLAKDTNTLRIEWCFDGPCTAH